jgi:hypothetical protein
MRTARLWKEIVVVTILLVYALPGPAIAEKSQVDLNALINETQKMGEKADEMTLVWWLPEEYWQTVFAQDATMTETQIEEFLSVLRPYTLVAVVDGKIGPFGGVTYKAEKEVRSGTRFIDNEGTDYVPFSEDVVDADAKNLLSAMKPVLANILGPMGQNVNFFLFPAKGKKGKKLADPTKEGGFTVKLTDRAFKWRLPLGSLLPSKTCPVDGEKLSGAWKFCPWHGVELK